MISSKCPCEEHFQLSMFHYSLLHWKCLQTEFSDTWLLGSEEYISMGIVIWRSDGSYWGSLCGFLFLFTRFLRVLQCDMIPKPFVYQHIQVWYICFSSQCQMSSYQCPAESIDDQWSVRPLVPFCLVADFFSSPPVEKLQSLRDEEWTVFLLQLCSSLGEQNYSAPLSSSSTPTPPLSTAVRSRLNLLCYLSCVVGHKVIANRLINSTMVGKHVFT